MKRTVRRRGTTLLEVMAAVFVLSLTVTAASAMFPLSAFLRDRSGGYSRGASIVQRKLEQVRRYPANQITYANLQSAGIIDEGETDPRPYNAADGLAGQLANGSGTLEITGVGTDVVQVNVALTWRGTRGTANRISATTRVVNKEAWRRP